MILQINNSADQTDSPAGESETSKPGENAKTKLSGEACM